MTGAVEGLDAEALGIGVAAVAGGAAAFGLGHRRLARLSRRLARSGDLDGGVVLAVTPAATLVGLVLVGEAVDLGALGLAHDPRRHHDAPASWSGVASTVVAVDDAARARSSTSSPTGAEQLDVETLAHFDPFLLATGLDHCVHRADHATGPRRHRSATATVAAGLRSSSVAVEEMPAAVAHRGTGSRSDSTQALADALAGHLDQAELGDVEDLGRGSCPGPAHRGSVADDLARGCPDLHVDEVDDDDPADVAQAQLAGDLLGRLEVVAEDRLLEARRTRRSCRC